MFNGRYTLSHFNVFKMALSDFILSEDDHFSIMEKYFDEKGPVFHQFESYEYMYETLFQKIIDETPSIHIETKTSKYKATFGQVYAEKASFIDESHAIKYITPKEARLRDLTYECPVFVDIREEFWDMDEKKEFEKVNEIDHKKVLLMKIPCMVRSSRCNLFGLSMDECVEKGECSNDPGGYFIINGKERALICQERLNYNQVYVFEGNDEKSPYSADIRSMSEETGHSVLLQARMTKEFKNISFMIPYMSKEVPAGAVFKALGMNSQDIFRFVNPATKEERVIVDRMIRESITLTDKKKAIQFISKASMHKVEDDDERRVIYTEQVIENELFPHMGICTPVEKCILLGDMLNKLFRVFLRKRLEDDRDNVSLKRIEGPGILVADLFRMSMKRYCDNLKKYLEKRQDVITSMNRASSITAVFRHTFSTGNWAAQKNSYVRTGVSQVMSRLTYPATISHLRRVVIPIGKEGKNVKIRQIHPTQAFFIDIIESPEGKSIGIVKNLSLLANITTGCNSILIREMIEKCEQVTDCDQYFDREDWFKIYLNGALIGLTHSPHDLYEEFRRLRKMGVFSSQVSFCLDEDDREIRVFSDHGRYMRPVMTVEDGNILKMKKGDLKMTWAELIENDIVRFIDSNEVENSLIAMTPDDLQKYANQSYDYCEIHPSAMLGVCSAVIPYPEHNQSPRLVYQSSMVKQALGVYALSFQERFDTVTHVMHYPQKPMVSTKFDKMLKFDEMLTGCNPIVAVVTYGGWNQEDSVMLNKSAVDRGMFVHTCYKTLTFEENKKTNCSFERIEVPPPKSQNKSSDYSKLGPNGIARKGVPVNKGDIIIGKTLTKVQKDDEEKIDCSLSVGNGEEGIVDGIWEGLNEEGYKMVKVRIRQLRTPEVGDKFASRSSQKGVCGLLLPQEDMPFTQEGITPDILINPHCMPSRMTMSQLIEMLLGKTAALSGKLGDSTAFSKSSINPTEAISKQLASLGFERHGNERLCSGYTGEMMQAEIFIGTAYYQRLKHLVKDKMHCLTLDHQVLTKDGWKAIVDITTSDRVATLCQTTGILEYQCPTNVWRYENYEGEMYHIKNESVDLSVTGKHRMWVKSQDPFNFVEASQCIGKSYQYKKDAEWRKIEYLHSTVDSFEEMDDFIESFRFYALKSTDGWIFDLSSRQSRMLIDAITNKKSIFTGTCEEVDRLQRLCLHAGWCSDVSDDCNVSNVTITIRRSVFYPVSEPYQEKLTHETCDVMCITVPNEIFYVRRNGKAVWTGNSRARGNVTMMHHQPSEGRSKDGGLRTGEMERDALIAHGGSAFIQETFFDMSDVYQVNVCEHCGSMLSAVKECRVCKKGDVNKTNIPYCAKLLLQELQALGVSIKINTASEQNNK